jgi:hypothetical protein
MCCVCEASLPVDRGSRPNPTTPQHQTRDVEQRLDAPGVRELYNSVDFVGISAYPRFKYRMSDMEDSTQMFDQELKVRVYAGACACVLGVSMHFLHAGECACAPPAFACWVLQGLVC